MLAAKMFTDILSSHLSGVCEPIVTIDVTPVTTIESYGVETPIPRGWFYRNFRSRLFDADAQKVKWGASKIAGSLAYLQAQDLMDLYHPSIVVLMGLMSWWVAKPR